MYPVKNLDLPAFLVAISQWDIKLEFLGGISGKLFRRMAESAWEPPSAFSLYPAWNSDVKGGVPVAIFRAEGEGVMVPSSEWRRKGLGPRWLCRGEKKKKSFFFEAISF